MSASEKIEVDPSSFPLDRYEPQTLLGQGAVGDVYKCHDRVLKKTVAVKCLRFLDAAQLLSFQNEARLLSSLQHSSIVKIFDFGIAGSAPYMVMELVDGVTLERLVEEGGPLAEEQAIGIFLAVCDALSYLHRNGCFHRDLKPANIVIVNDSLSGHSPELSQRAIEVRLIDFGMADVKSQLQEPTIVHGRTIVGTPAFMSPDQINGESFDSASEVYSLGGVMFFALTGEPPFGGDTPMEIFSRQMNSEAPLLSEIVGEDQFSERTEELVARCLSNERKSRYQTVEAVREALLRLRDRSDADEIESNAAETEPDSAVTTAPLLSNKGVVMGVAVCSLIMASVVFSYFLVTPKAVRNQNISMFKPKVSRPKARFDSYYNILSSDGRMLFSRVVKGVGTRYSSASSQVTDADLKLLKEAPEFTNLDISRTQVTGDGIKHLVRLPIHSMEVADLSLTDKGIDYICQMSQLRKLDLGCVPVSGQRLRKLVSSLPNLEVLILDQCAVTDDDLKTLPGLKELKVVSLQNSKATYKGLRYLTALKDLSKINLAGSAITDDDLRKLRIEDFPSIKALEIGRCPKVTRAAVAALERRRPGLSTNYSISDKEVSSVKMVEFLGDSGDSGSR